MRHSKGKWHKGAGNGEGAIFSDDGRMRLEPGGTTLYPICTICRGWEEGEDEANGDLIAASPELLKACERALPWIGKLIAENVHLKSVAPNDAVRTMELLETAIKKAGGTE